MTNNKGQIESPPGGPLLGPPQSDRRGDSLSANFKSDQSARKKFLIKNTYPLHNIKYNKFQKVLRILN